MATVRILGSDGIEQVIDLRATRVQIGRGRDSDIVLSDPDKGVSRAHAELRVENDRYVIVDLQSQNGTYLNGRRVDRAEVPFGAEIAIGAYRLTLLASRPAAVAAPPRMAVDPLDDMRATERHEAPKYRPQPPAPAAPAGAPQRWVIVAAAVVVLSAGIAGVAWLSSSRPSNTAAAPATAGVPPAPAAANDPAVVQEPAGTAERTDGPPADAESLAPRPASNAQPVVPKPRTGTGIARRPGESTEAWRSREAALQTRYGYSKAALDRGDYAAAAGGFEAILLEEPGFLDAPRLLVQAQAGLRANARTLFDAADRLDRAGDWMGALARYEQARQVHAGLPGLTERIARARARLQAAGKAALAQGQEHEAAGRVAEAIREYEKAVQWLPTDDPGRQAARSRIAQLRKSN